MFNLKESVVLALSLCNEVKIIVKILKNLRFSVDISFRKLYHKQCIIVKLRLDIN